MPAKRSLRLDDELDGNSLQPSKITREKKSITVYSPTTGTCQMSPFTSPTNTPEQKHKNGSSNGKRIKLNHLGFTKRKESTLKDSEFMLLLSKVEKSSEEIMEITQALNSIQALEGSRELENLIGFIRAPRFLKRDMQKTKELMTKATEQKLFEKKSSEQSNKDLRRLGSYEFLKAILP
ncbi:centromere protein R isoform X2 [Erinaceus europaeus]|uniref:Centromere protein R n=1 Tax=Erinaceus europaeus TaxID=9365 RepID=A0A1S3WAL5_ERIEU|nr:centromere protein R isoform X2 [Erinaceus europaeus]